MLVWAVACWRLDLSDPLGILWPGLPLAQTVAQCLFLKNNTVMLLLCVHTRSDYDAGNSLQQASLAAAFPISFLSK